MNTKEHKIMQSELILDTLNKELIPCKLIDADGEEVEFEVYLSFHADERSHERYICKDMVIDSIEKAVAKNLYGDYDLLMQELYKEAVIRDKVNNLAIPVVCGYKEDGMPFFIVKTVFGNSKKLAIYKHCLQVYVERHHHASFSKYYTKAFY